MTHYGESSWNIESQSPRIGAVFPTEAPLEEPKGQQKVSIPSNRGGVSYPGSDLGCEVCGRSLNPLESGRCFLLLSRLAKGSVTGASLNPLESGRCFLLSVMSVTNLGPPAVSIPSNRGGVSYLVKSVQQGGPRYRLNPLESGRCFLLS